MALSLPHVTDSWESLIAAGEKRRLASRVPEVAHGLADSRGPSSNKHHSKWEIKGKREEVGKKTKGI